MHRNQHQARYAERDYAAMASGAQMPVISSIGMGPRGEGLRIANVVDEPGNVRFSVVSDITGEVVWQSPNLAPADVSFAVYGDTAYLVVVKDGKTVRTPLTLPKGEDGAEVHMVDAVYPRMDDDTYTCDDSIVDKDAQGQTRIRVGDAVFFKYKENGKVGFAIGSVQAYASGSVMFTGRIYLPLPDVIKIQEGSPADIEEIKARLGNVENDVATHTNRITTLLTDVSANTDAIHSAAKPEDVDNITEPGQAAPGRLVTLAAALKILKRATEDLARVARTGSYLDLKNTPDLGKYAVKGDIASVNARINSVAAQKLDIATGKTWAKVISEPRHEGRNIRSIDFSMCGAAGPRADQKVYEFLHDRIMAGDWTGLKVGDWFRDISTVPDYDLRMAIAGFDTFLGTAPNTPLDDHHIVLIIDEPFQVMAGPDAANSSGLMLWTTDNHNNGSVGVNEPYLFSSLQRWGKNWFEPKLRPDFLQWVPSRKTTIEKKYDDNGLLKSANGWSTTEIGKFWEPSFVEVCGHKSWGSQWAASAGHQLPYFLDQSKRVFIDSHSTSGKRWWLRDTDDNSNIRAGIVDGDGCMNTEKVGSSAGAYAYVRKCCVLAKKGK